MYLLTWNHHNKNTNIKGGLVLIMSTMKKYYSSKIVNNNRLIVNA